MYVSASDVRQDGFMKAKFLILLAMGCVAAAATLLARGCGATRHHVINVVGSTSVQPFAEMLAQEFNTNHPGVAIDVQGGGSSQGLKAVTDDIADIGMCSRALTKDETGYVPIPIARDGLAIVVHPSNPIVNLPRETVARIFSGAIRNWKELGGVDATIHCITREEGSGTREAFEKMIMHDRDISRKAVTQESNGAVKELVRQDRAGIGYMSLGLVGEELKALSVDGVVPSHQTVRSGTYPLVRPFLFILKKDTAVNPDAQNFIDFVLSPPGQQMLEKEGLVGR